MRETVINNCKLLVENKEVLNKTFFGNYEILNIAAACQLTCDGKKVDKDMLKRTNAILKDNTGVFSTLRGFVKIPLISNMLVSGEPEAYVEKVKMAKDYVEKHKFLQSDYHALTADILAKNVNQNEYEKYADAAADIYNRMKKEHPFLTSQEDLPFAMLLAINNADTDAVMKEAENCFNYLKSYFFSKNSIQSVSHVLALSDKPTEEKCERFLRLLDMLKKAGHKFGKDQGLAVLAALAILDKDDAEIVDDISAADDYLKKCKGFGDFVLGSYRRRMFAAQMALVDSTPINAAAATSAISTSVAVTIAIEVCMITVITTATIATNAASH